MEALVNIDDFKEGLLNTKQNPVWHQEGNVYIHSKMVAKELLKLKEFKSLSIEKQKLLYTAALFHDIGKIPTTKETNGIIASIGHGFIGARMFRNKYFDDLDFYTREAIALLINLHGRPVYFYKEKKQNIILLSEELKSFNLILQDLYLLSMADIKGRITKDPQDREELVLNVDYFKEIANEYGLYTSYKEWRSEEEKEYFLRTKREYKPYTKVNRRFIMVAGLPGVGKDYYIENKLLKELDPNKTIVISLDDIRKEFGYENKKTDLTEGRVVQEARKRVQRYLALDYTVIFNATNVSKKRKTFLGLAQNYKAITEIHYLEKQLHKVILQDNKRKGWKYVGEKVIFKMLYKLDLPTMAEAVKVKYIIS